MKTDTIHINREQQVEVLTFAEIAGHEIDGGENRFQIVWLTGGVLEYKVDMSPGRMAAGQVLRVRPGEVFKIEHADNTSGYLVRIENGFLEGLEHRLLLSAGPTGITINDETSAELGYITNKIKEELSHGDVLQEDILRRYTEIFLIHLARSVKDMFGVTVKTRNVELTEDFISLLDRRYKETKMVSDYASLLAVTPNYLNEIVKKITGQSAGHHIRQRIALEAKRHATYSSLCMKEVAYALGFADIAHFSKFFKNATGRNFSDFRKERVVYNLYAKSAA